MSVPSLPRWTLVGSLAVVALALDVGSATPQEITPKIEETSEVEAVYSIPDRRQKSRQRREGSAGRVGQPSLNLRHPLLRSPNVPH
jgi:hypothetical protein